MRQIPWNESLPDLELPELDPVDVDLDLDDYLILAQSQYWNEAPAFDSNPPAPVAVDTPYATPVVGRSARRVACQAFTAGFLASTATWLIAMATAALFIHLLR